MNDEIVYLISAPNEPIARLWEQMLLDAGIPSLVRPGGPGAGGWGSVATFAHDLFVREGDFERAERIIADGDGDDASTP